MEQQHTPAKSGGLMMAAILLTSIVMRSAISAVSPVLQIIRETYGLNNALAGSITTIPMLLFAAMSLASPLLLRKMPASKLQLWSMALVCAGLLMRSYLGVVGLFAGTVLLGLGIGVCNVLIPRTIKQDFPNRVELLTGLYTSVMSLFAALASGFSIPISTAVGWQQALSLWALFAAAALVAWVFICRSKTELQLQQDTSGGIKPLLKSSMAWKITLCMGSQSAAYFSVVAWMPTFLQNLGESPQAAGYIHLFVQMAGMVSAFLVPVLMRKARDHRTVLIPSVLALIIGLASMLFELPLFLRYPLLLCVGFGMGSGLSYTMTILSLRAESPSQVVSLSALAQTGGYIIAAIGPTLVGAIYDIFQSLPMQIISIMLFGVVYLVFGSMVAIRPGGQKGV